MNLRQVFCLTHDPEVVGKPYPYPTGVDNPFTEYSTGWGRAWEVPVRCTKCGYEYTKHVLAPKLLSKKATFYWSAHSSNIELAVAITNKLNAITSEQLQEIHSCLYAMDLDCEVCDFTTIVPLELINHIWDKHRVLLERDVLSRCGI